MLMSRPPAIDPDLLRVFAFIAEECSFTRAAQLVGRTQSAVSMQMQRLEALLGAPLLLSRARRQCRTYPTRPVPA